MAKASKTVGTGKLAEKQRKAARESFLAKPYGERFMRSLQIRYEGMDVNDGVESQAVIDAVETLVTDDNFQAANTRQEVLNYARTTMKENGVSGFNIQYTMLILEGVCDHVEGKPMPWDPSLSHWDMEDFETAWKTDHRIWILG